MISVFRRQAVKFTVCKHWPVNADVFVPDIAEADGDAQRFLEQLSAYRGAPAQTRRRLWLEFISECFSMIDQKYILNSQDGKVPARLRLRAKL